MMPASDLERLVYCRPGYLIRRLHQLATTAFLEETSQSGLTPVQYGALVAIKSHAGIDQLRVANAIGIDRTTISGVVERLQAKGLIDRKTGASDRRTKQLFITSLGQRTLVAMAAGAERAQERTLRGLDDAEKNRFVEALAKLVSTNNDINRVPVQEP